MPALVAALLVAAVSPAAANETVYNEDGYKLVVGMHAGSGVFGANDVDFGAGGVNSRAPLGGPFPASEPRATRTWFEVCQGLCRDRNAVLRLVMVCRMALSRLAAPMNAGTTARREG